MSLECDQDLLTFSWKGKKVSIFPEDIRPLNGICLYELCHRYLNRRMEEKIKLMECGVLSQKWP